MSKLCIRVFADVAQINQCKSEILQVEESISNVARVLYLTGNEVRLKILYLLNKEKKMCPCDLSDILVMTVPAVSQHLKKLREGGFIFSEKVGQTVFYSIVSDHSAILDPVFKLITLENIKGMRTQESNKLAITSILTAVGASLCCITPVLALIVGISGAASAFSWLEPGRPYFAGITLLVLGLAWYQKIKPQKQEEIDCACEDEEKPSFWQSKIFLGMITILALLMLAFPYYAEKFYPSHDNKEVTIVHADQIQTTEFSIKGMTCQGCAAHVENEVNKLPGIISVAASYELSNAKVEYDKSKINLLDIEAAIKSTGYKIVKE